MIKILDTVDDGKPEEELERTATIFSASVNLTNTIIAGGLGFISTPFSVRLIGVGLSVIVISIFIVVNLFSMVIYIIYLNNIATQCNEKQNKKKLRDQKNPHTHTHTQKKN